MRIALCDIDRSSIRNAKHLIYQYSNRFRMDLLIDEYVSGEALINSGNKYDIIFLEYRLLGINGLETAQRIRALGINCAIIFLSGCTDFILESFRVNPFRFLVKPVPDNLLLETLEEFFEQHGCDYPLWMKSGDNTVCLSTGDIYYLEADNKHCRISLKNEIIPCNKTMAKVYAALPKSHFYKINRAFVVNFSHISSYNNDMVFLTNGKGVHISRKYLKSFKEDYKSFCEPIIPE